MRLAAVSLIAALAAPLQAFAGAAQDAEVVRAIVSDKAGADGPGCAVGVFKDDKTFFVAGGSADIAARRRRTPTRCSIRARSVSSSRRSRSPAGDRRQGQPRRRRAQILAGDGSAQHAHHGRHAASPHLRHPQQRQAHSDGGYEHMSQSTRTDTLAMLLHYPQTAFPPGATFEYSNGGYCCSR